MGLMNIDIGDTRAKARKLDELSTKVRRVADGQMNDVCNNLSTVWRGEGANRYRKKLNKVQSRVRKRSNNLKTIAGGLRASMDRIQRIEDFAKRLFSN